MLILVLVLVLKDSLRTFFKSLSLSWSLGVRSLSLSLSLGGQVQEVLVLVLGGQVLVLVLVLEGQVLVLVLVLGGRSLLTSLETLSARLNSSVITYSMWCDIKIFNRIVASVPSVTNVYYFLETAATRGVSFVAVSFTSLFAWCRELSMLPRTLV